MILNVFFKIQVSDVAAVYFLENLFKHLPLLPRVGLQLQRLRF